MSSLCHTWSDQDTVIPTLVCFILFQCHLIGVHRGVMLFKDGGTGGETGVHLIWGNSAAGGNTEHTITVGTPDTR